MQVNVLFRFGAVGALQLAAKDSVDLNATASLKHRAKDDSSNHRRSLVEAPPSDWLAFSLPGLCELTGATQQDPKVPDGGRGNPGGLNSAVTRSDPARAPELGKLA
jgi:hypothetical protein